jgi:hypothetical protein
MTGTVACGDCETILVDETPYDKERAPCPVCESNRRHLLMNLTDEIRCYESLCMKQKQAGIKKPVLEHFDGDDYTHRTGRYSKKTRIIDRKNDRYYEVVRDRDSGEILHECGESLSQHFGHGSAKEKSHGLGHNDIAEAAHFIWINEGRPAGRHLAHWFMAIDELRRRR